MVKMEKIFAVLVLASLIAVGCVQTPPQASPTPSALPSAIPSATPTAIGGDTDAHGCLIAAGYSWCDVKQKCLRPWEENCSNEIPSGFSIQSSGTCDRQNSSASLHFRNQTSFSIIIDFPGSVCKKFGIQSVQVLKSYQVQMVITLKHEVNPAATCVQCAGVSTAEIDGAIEAPVGSIIVMLDGYRVASLQSTDVFCGGIAGFACPLGFECKLDGTYPDAGGKCVQAKTPSPAVIQATQTCVNANLTGPAFEGYNENSKTYWFSLTDANGNYQGCSPACVVFENLTAEVNYRCTGLAG